MLQSLEARSSPSAGLERRWLVVAGLLGGEALTLSLLVDFPQRGPAHALASGLRVIFPVGLAALIAGVLLARARATDLVPERVRALPPWRPIPALVLNALAFAGTAAWAHQLMGSDAPPPGAGVFAAWVGCAIVTALLAVCTGAPPVWLARRVLASWREPVAAVLLGASAWGAASATEQLWGTLSSATLRGAAALLSWTAGPVTLDLPNRVIGLSGFEVEVAAVCSGTDGIGLVLIFLGIWIALARARLRIHRALILLPLGVAAAFLANIVRVAALVAVGGAGHHEVAVGGFHSKLGWFLFCGIALAGIAAAESVRWFRREPSAAEKDAAVAAGDGSHAHRPTGLEDVNLILPLMAALATSLTTGLFAADVDLAYGARIAAAVAALVAIRRIVPSLRPGRPLVAILAGCGLAVAWIAWAGDANEPIPQGLTELDASWRAVWIGIRVLGGVAVIPLIEELAYRGFLLDWLAGAGWRSAPPAARPVPWWALLGSSVAFGALHEELLLGIVSGVLFAALRLGRGRIGDAVLAHAACNGALALAVLLGGRWQLWG